MLSVFQVADYLLSLESDENGDLMSNLKLQKLVYYAQGVNLALHGQPLFPEELHAWMHGPVVPELYHRYKEFGAGPLPRPVIEDFSIYSEQDKAVMNDVYDVFGQFAAWKLASMTHEEVPWKEASPGRGVMCLDTIKKYFEDEIVQKQ